MIIYVSHARSFDFKNELYSPLKNGTFPQKHLFVLPHESEGIAMNIDVKKIFDAQCDLVVAEVSYPSTGQGIELAWADQHKLPIVCFYKKGNTYSSSLSHVCKKFVAYEGTEDMVKKLNEYLEEM